MQISELQAHGRDIGVCRATRASGWKGAPFEAGELFHVLVVVV